MKNPYAIALSSPAVRASLSTNTRAKELLRAADQGDSVGPVHALRLRRGQGGATRAGSDRAVRQLRQTLASIQSGDSLQTTMQGNLLPDVLMDHSESVVPYLVMREGVVKRLYDLNIGYWQPDRAGVDVLDKPDWARAFALGGVDNPSAFAKATERLLDSGEAVLPLELVEIGLVQHPDSPDLLALRERCLERLRLFHATSNPFKFIVYSEEADAELGPLNVE